MPNLIKYTRTIKKPETEEAKLTVALKQCNYSKSSPVIITLQTDYKFGTTDFSL
jgi:hypothetical protein